MARGQVLGSCSRVTCHVSHVHTLAYPTVRRNIRYLIFIIRVHYVLHTIQSHSAGLSLPLVCVPEEYTMRGEVRREKVADLLAPMIQTLVLQQQLCSGRQPRARARSGGGEGWNVQNFYILLDEEERM